MLKGSAATLRSRVIVVVGQKLKGEERRGKKGTSGCEGRMGEDETERVGGYSRSSKGCHSSSSLEGDGEELEAKTS
jgi:hypothetical protein